MFWKVFNFAEVMVTSQRNVVLLRSGSFKSQHKIKIHFIYFNYFNYYKEKNYLYFSKYIQGYLTMLTMLKIAMF